MAPEKCRLCGSKFTGMFKVGRPCPETERAALVYGIDASELCIACCVKEAEQTEIKYRLEHSKLINGLKGKILLLSAEIANLNEKPISVFTTPHPYEWNAEIKGVVTGYSVLGTGIISEIVSNITDMVGAESQTFINKLQEGEKRAIASAKAQAIIMGANAISGLSISVTEATSASGMLMISCAGTAIFSEHLQLKTSMPPRIEECQAEIESLQTQLSEILPPSPLKIIITDSSERYRELASKLNTDM